MSITHYASTDNSSPLHSPRNNRCVGSNPSPYWTCRSALAHELLWHRQTASHLNRSAIITGFPGSLTFSCRSFNRSIIVNRIKCGLISDRNIHIDRQLFSTIHLMDLESGRCDWAPKGMNYSLCEMYPMQYFKTWHCITTPFMMILCIDSSYDWINRHLVTS